MSKSPSVSTLREQEVIDRFAKDIASHKLILLRDDGVYRHLLCKSPDTSEYWFEIITTPNLLTINGDMGCHVFSRTHDMFRFFGNGPINPSYWAEKLMGREEAKIREHSDACLQEMILEYLDDLTDDLVPAELESLRHAVHEEFFGGYGYGENADAAYRDLEAFEHNGFQFLDVFEWDFRIFTFRFLWNLHAIVWAIGKYRELKTASWEVTEWDGGYCQITSANSSVVIEAWMLDDEEEANVIVERVVKALNREIS